jgi:hypothetical protein
VFRKLIRRMKCYGQTTELQTARVILVEAAYMLSLLGMKECSLFVVPRETVFKVNISIVAPHERNIIHIQQINMKIRTNYRKVNCRLVAYDIL